MGIDFSVLYDNQIPAVKLRRHLDISEAISDCCVRQGYPTDARHNSWCGQREVVTRDYYSSGDVVRDKETVGLIEVYVEHPDSVFTAMPSLLRYVSRDGGFPAALGSIDPGNIPMIEAYVENTEAFYANMKGGVP